jgi:hypothetical protein
MFSPNNTKTRTRDHLNSWRCGSPTKLWIEFRSELALQFTSRSMSFFVDVKFTLKEKVTPMVSPVQITVLLYFEGGLDRYVIPKTG